MNQVPWINAIAAIACPGIGFLALALVGLPAAAPALVIGGILGLLNVAAFTNGMRGRR